MEEKIVPITTERALALCARSVGSDKSIIKRMLDEKKAEAFTIGDCCFITRFEQTDQNKEIVVMCAEGKGLNQSARLLRKVAKIHGCNTARMHTSRPALQRLASEFGWVQDEIVYKMKI